MMTFFVTFACKCSFLVIIVIIIIIIELLLLLVQYIDKAGEVLKKGDPKTI